MNFQIKVILLWLGLSTTMFSQVSFNKTGAPADPSSAVDIQDDTKGFLLPRLTRAERDQIASPAHSLLIYQTDEEKGYYFNAGTKQNPVWTPMDGGQDAALTRTLITTLPYDITQPGSYLVAAPLTGTAGITISASNVTLDLNQYTLLGASGNTTRGIRIQGEQTNVSILNGSIRNWKGSGLDGTACTGMRISHLIVAGNEQDGILVGNGAVITSCIATGNTMDGIDAGNASVITACSVSGNGDNGIETDEAAVIQGNAVFQNAKSGIYTGSGAQISGNTCRNNQQHGIESGMGSLVQANNSTGNTLCGFMLQNGSTGKDNTAKDNVSHGFSAQQDVVLVNNSADSNGQHGFYSSFDGGKLEGNQSSDNTSGFYISGSGWLVIRNTASNNASGGFTIAPSNTKAPVLTSVTLATASHPFANIEY